MAGAGLAARAWPLPGLPRTGRISDLQEGAVPCALLSSLVPLAVFGHRRRRHSSALAASSSSSAGANRPAAAASNEMLDAQLDSGSNGSAGSIRDLFELREQVQEAQQQRQSKPQRQRQQQQQRQQRRWQAPPPASPRRQRQRRRQLLPDSDDDDVLGGSGGSGGSRGGAKGGSTFFRTPLTPEQERLLSSRSAEELLGHAEACGSSSTSLPATVAAAALTRLSGLLRNTTYQQRQAMLQHPGFPPLFRALQSDTESVPISDLVVMLKVGAFLPLRMPRPLLEAVTDQLAHRLPAMTPADAVTAAWALAKLRYPGLTTLLTAIDALVRRQQQQQREREAQEQQQQQQSNLPGSTAAQVEAQPATAAAAGGSGVVGGAPLPWMAQLSPVSLVSLLWACSKAPFRSLPLLQAITGTLLLHNPSASKGGSRAARTQDGSAASAPAATAADLTGDVAAAEHAAAGDNGSGSSGDSRSSSGNSGSNGGSNASRSKKSGRRGGDEEDDDDGGPLSFLTTQLLSMTFYSCGALQWAPSQQFLEHAARQVQANLPDFAPQGLANIAWSLSKMGREAELTQLAAAVAGEAAIRLPAFSNQDLAILVMSVAAPGWAGARRSTQVDALLAATDAELARRAQQLNSRDLSGMISALATAKHCPSTAVLDAVAARVEQLLSESGGKGSSSSSKSKASDSSSKAIGTSDSDSNSGSPSSSNGNGSSRGSSLGSRDGGGSGSSGSSQLSPSALAWLLWAFVRMRYRPPRSLLRKVEAALRGPMLLKLYGMEPADVARMCWALAELRHYSGGLLADLAMVLRSMWQRLTPQSMAMVLHSYALQRFTPHDLLDVAAEHLAANLEQYGQQALAVMLWGFAKLEVHPGRGLPAGGPCTPDGTPLLTAVAQHSLQYVNPLPASSSSESGSSSSESGSSSTGSTLTSSSSALQRPQHQQQRQQQLGPGPAQAFTLQGLSMLLWSLGKLEHNPGTPLLAAACSRFVEALRKGELQQGLGRPEESGSSSSSSSTRAGAYTDGMLVVANTAWGLAQSSYVDQAFFHAVAEALPALTAQLRRQREAAAAEAAGAADSGAEAVAAYFDEEEEEEPHGLVTLALATAKLRPEAAELLLHRLLPAIEEHAGRLSAAPACQLLWAYSSLGQQLPVALLDTVVERIRLGIAGCDPRLLCMAVHSLARQRYVCDAALLDEAVRQVAASDDEVSVSWLAKLLWGCAHVGHEPDVEQLEEVCGELYFQLSHRRGTRTVLNVSDLVLLLWALAVLQQYSSQLYRHCAFRATRLPDGVPREPSLRRLLREATVLHSCEHRLDPVAADAAAAILPAWMQPAAREAAAVADPDPRAGDNSAAVADASSSSSGGSSDGTTQGGSSSNSSIGFGILPPTELRAAAQAVFSTLQSAAIPCSLKQLSFGEYIVLIEPLSGSTRRGALGAVVPAAGRNAVNNQDQVLGSALVAQRVLAARGLKAVPSTGSDAELVARCRSLILP